MVHRLDFTKIKMFIDEKMIPDIYDIAYYYSEYYKIGGGYDNLLSYGLFNNFNELGTLYVEPLVLTKNGIEVFDENKIQEKIDYAYYKSPENTYQPDKIVPQPDRGALGHWLKIKDKKISFY